MVSAQIRNLVDAGSVSPWLCARFYYSLIVTDTIIETDDTGRHSLALVSRAAADEQCSHLLETYSTLYHIDAPKPRYTLGLVAVRVKNLVLEFCFWR